MAETTTSPDKATQTGEPCLLAIDAVRAGVLSDAATPETILGAVRASVRADELVLVRERDERFVAAASPAIGRPADVPEGIVRDLLLELPRAELIEQPTSGSLAAALQMRGHHIVAAFTSGSGPIEVLLAGWKGDVRVEPIAFEALARAVGLAVEVVSTRDARLESRFRRERSRWAGEIHDGLTQAVTSAFLELQTLRSRIAVEPDAAIDSLDDVMHDVRRALLEVRGVLFDLTDAAEARAVDPMAAYVREVAERWSIPVEIQVDDHVDGLPRPMLSVARMVVREGLANAARHAEADSVVVRMYPQAASLEVEITDDGRGFDAAGVPDRPGHLGLGLLRERVTEAGGTVQIRSEPGRGARIVTQLPIANQGEGS